MEFNLSDEQKRKIEQEEAARLAEERYREQVRRSMRASTVSDEQPARPAEAGKAEHGVRFGWGFRVALAALVFLGGSWLVSLLSRSGTPNDANRSSSSSLLSRWEPVTISLVNEQFQVPAQQYRQWNTVVPAGVRNYRITGHFSVIGGGANDIQAVIATDDEFQNWINGHQARVFYSTPGRVTTGNINVVLLPGRYVLAFNNRFSFLTPKAVFAQINATYEQSR